MVVVVGRKNDADLAGGCSVQGLNTTQVAARLKRGVRLVKISPNR